MLPTDTETNGLAVISLTLAVLPALATFATTIYVRSSYEMLRAFFSSGAGGDLNRAESFSCFSSFLALFLAVRAVHCRPGPLANVVFTVALISLLLLMNLPVLLPLRIR